MVGEVVDTNNGEDAPGRVAIPDATTPQFKDSPWNSPTICVDGLAGMAVSPHQVKVMLAEHFPTAAGLAARHVGTLVLPVDQFLKVVDGLTKVAQDLRDREVKAE